MCYTCVEMSTTVTAALLLVHCWSAQPDWTWRENKSLHTDWAYWQVSWTAVSGEVMWSKRKAWHFTYCAHCFVKTAILNSMPMLLVDIFIKMRITVLEFPKVVLLDRSVWKSHNLIRTTKFLVYKVMTLSILLYDNETWTVYQWNVNRFHLQCVRRISGNSVIGFSSLYWGISLSTYRFYCF